MWAIFKPLFIFKKYVLAHEVLKESCSSIVWATNSDDEEKYLSEKNFGETYLSVFLLTRKDIDTVRLIESIEILEKNKHVITRKNSNLYKYSIEPTKKGERAFNDGYYMTKSYKSIFAIYGSTAGILTLLITYLPKLIRYLSK